MAADVFLGNTTVSSSQAAVGVKKYIENTGHALTELPPTLQSMLANAIKDSATSKKQSAAPSAIRQHKSQSTDVDDKVDQMLKKDKKDKKDHKHKTDKKDKKDKKGKHEKDDKGKVEQKAKKRKHENDDD